MQSTKKAFSILYLLSELALPAIAVSLATSLVAAPYLLIRNYYHKKVAPFSKGAYALHNFLMLWGLEDLI